MVRTEILVSDTESAITPMKLTAMAMEAPRLNVSPNRIRPRIATCTVSVFENVVPTAKLRNENIHTRNTVNRICASPPRKQNIRNLAFGVGSA